jgi:hypothetical protein
VELRKAVRAGEAVDVRMYVRSATLDAPYNCLQNPFQWSLTMVKIPLIIDRMLIIYGTSSGYDNFQNNQNSDFQKSRSVILSCFYQILSSGYLENYQNQNWCRKERSKQRGEILHVWTITCSVFFKLKY